MKEFSYPPAVSSTEAQIDGQVYNTIRIALNRLGAPLHVVVPGSWGYEMVLDEERWLCRDRWQTSKPLVVLCDFKPQKRTRIDEQVSCRRLCSRSYAGMDVGSLLREVTLVLRKRLENRPRSGEARLLRLNVTVR